MYVCVWWRLREERDRLVWSPEHQLALIAANVKELVAQQGAILLEHIAPALRVAGGGIVRRFEDLGAGERARLRRVFTEELELLLTPIALDPSQPFPFLPSLGIGIAVRLQEDGLDSQVVQGRGSPSYAVVSIPPTVDRWVEVEGEEGQRLHLPVEQLIISHLGQLFGGWTVIDAWTCVCISHSSHQPKRTSLFR